MLCLALPIPAFAENWEVIGSTGEVTHLVYTDFKVGNELVTVRWKTRSPTKEVVYKGFVDCERWALTRSVEMETDLRSGQSSSIPEETKRQTLFPNYPGLTTAPEIEFVCKKTKPEVIAKMTALPSEGCASPTSDPVKELCSYGPEFRANSYLFWRRTEVTRYPCGDSKEDFVTAAMEFFRQRSLCKDQKCRDEVADRAMSMIVMDFEAADRWSQQGKSFPLPGGTCRFVSTLKKEAQERERSVIAMNNFKQCVLNKVERLDDRQSSAEVIARALQNACKSEFSAVLAVRDITTPGAQELVRKAFEDNVIQTVLEHRTARRKKK